MPRVVVLYGTTIGSTAEVAGWIAARLREHDPHVELAQARTARIEPAVARPDLVVLGGAIYTGRWHRDAHRFLRRNRREPVGVPIAVFGMGPRRGTAESWQRVRAQPDPRSRPARLAQPDRRRRLRWRRSEGGIVWREARPARPRGGRALGRRGPGRPSPLTLARLPKRLK